MSQRKSLVCPPPDLRNVDVIHHGGVLEHLPEGMEVDHVIFAEGRGRLQQAPMPNDLLPREQSHLLPAMRRFPQWRRARSPRRSWTTRRPTGSLRVASGGGADARSREDGGQGSDHRGVSKESKERWKSRGFFLFTREEERIWNHWEETSCAVCALVSSAREDGVRLIRKLLASVTTDTWVLNIGVQ
jgi:hypothetical protein